MIDLKFVFFLSKHSYISGNVKESSHLLVPDLPTIRTDFVGIMDDDSMSDFQALIGAHAAS